VPERQPVDKGPEADALHHPGDAEVQGVCGRVAAGYRALAAAT
jgi:hypothetical protein